MQSWGDTMIPFLHVDIEHYSKMASVSSAKKWKDLHLFWNTILSHLTCDQRSKRLDVIRIRIQFESFWDTVFGVRRSDVKIVTCVCGPTCVHVQNYIIRTSKNAPQIDWLSFLANTVVQIAKRSSANSHHLNPFDRMTSLTWYRAPESRQACSRKVRFKGRNLHDGEKPLKQMLFICMRFASAIFSHDADKNLSCAKQDAQRRISRRDSAARLK